MSQRDLINRSLDAGREATTKAQERLETVLNDLAATAQSQADQAQKLAQEVSERFIKSWDTEVRKLFTNAGLATKADIRRLEKKIETLTGATAGKGAAAPKPAKRASAKKAPAKKAPAKKAPAKKAPAKKAR